LEKYQSFDTYLDDIAKAERIDASFVGRILRLALLAPDIVEMILEGKQPAHFSLKDLMVQFPVDWHDQRARLQIHAAF